MEKIYVSTLGESIYNEIDENRYLHEIYENLLYNYSMKVISKRHLDKEINIDHCLRFADILSKSADCKNSEKHKVWAQQIITLLNDVYPKNDIIQTCASSVLSTIGNYRGLDLIRNKFKNTSFLDEIYNCFDLEYLSIPYQNDKFFFHAQKEIYKHLDDESFSYSGPTSLGKSLLMRMFIKDKIMNGSKDNFVILVPTKALITEISSNICSDLKEDLANNNYKVVNSGNSLFLKQEDLHYIFVLTPERMLYTLISYPEIQINYLFIDEAHKISEGDGRSAFYYKVTDMLAQKPVKPHILLASPNIPNPQEYLKIIPRDLQYNQDSLSTSFSPVSQVKFYVDLINKQLSVYNEYKKEFLPLTSLEYHTYSTIIQNIIMKDENKSNIVYVNSKDKAIDLAREYAKNLPYLNNPKLEALANEIINEIHDSYFLVDIIKKGVAFHVGYLPMYIRTTIEKSFRDRLIKTLFCTSTLIEGVNLPADNMFVMSHKVGRSTMNPVEFKNLIGRVGRIEYNLFGNVFLIRYDEKTNDKQFKSLLVNEVPEQKISLTNHLKEKEKKYIIDKLKNGDAEFMKLNNQRNDEYELMRKIGLILLKDITSNRVSVVTEQFKEYLDQQTITLIKNNFLDTIAEIRIDDDINVSPDQNNNITYAIMQGLKYPDIRDDKINYDELVSFLKRLHEIFKWSVYESSTLGNINVLDYYAVILSQWMSGYGLKQILNQAIEYKRKNMCPNIIYSFDDNYSKIKINKDFYPYNDSLSHQNAVISESLGIIDNVILFSIANYFLRFSTEYKRLKTNGEPFDNDWYEYVEYGSLNTLTIFFQRNGFSRDTADYIREHKDKYVVETLEGYKLKKELFDCGKDSVIEEVKDIQYNVPELFIE